MQAQAKRYMRINLIARDRGSVLMMTLLTALVIGIILASCLGLVSNQNSSTMRSLEWNTAIPVAEAGVEEAFSHLNADAGSLTANGWASQQVNGQTIYTKRRDFASDGSYCLMTISNVTAAPVIFSRAYVPAPLKKGVLTRAVRVTTVLTGQSAPVGVMV